MAYIEYAKYIASGKWKQKRKRIFERAYGLCERCGIAPPQDVHHKSYAHFGDELDEELLAVCKPCHKELEEAAGGYYGPRKKKAKKAKNKRPWNGKRWKPHLDLRYARPHTRVKWWRKLTDQFLSGGGAKYPGTLAEFNAAWDAKVNPEVLKRMNEKRRSKRLPPI